MVEPVAKLKRFVKCMQCGEAMNHANLTVVPVRGECESVQYKLGQDAIEEGLLEVGEVSESGSVPELFVTSSTDSMVLLIDGEELVGAKQNRILNTTILLPAMAKIRIPVSCVEQGRWRHVSDKFKAGNFSPSKLRAAKSRSVGRNLREVGDARSDQGEVWDNVAECMRAAKASSPTMAMSDIVNQRRASLDDFVNALTYPAGARGAIIAINGRFAVLDIFDRAETLQKLWKRLVSGYALDALGRQSGEPFNEFTAKGAGAVLEHVGELACDPCTTSGAGEDWRFESEGIVGQALILGDVCVHMSAFPNEADARPSRELGRIRRPSERRRNWRRPPNAEL